MSNSNEWRSLNSCSFLGNDLVDSDVVVVETGEEEVSALVPGQTGASNWGWLLFSVGVNGDSLEVNDELLGGEIPDLDTVVSTENEPVVLGGEEHAVDWAVDFLLSEEFALNEVPDHGETVFTTWS